MRLFKFVHPRLLLAGTLLLAFGCSKPGKEALSADGNSATFRVERGSVDGTTDTVLDGDVWQKPYDVGVTFTACMVDSAQDKPLLGKYFHVQNPVDKSSPADLEVTPDGCLSWKEPIAFDYFAGRSRWVTIDRDIVGTGVATGTRRVTYAVNPWLLASRAEIKPAKAGYFLRDDPVELTKPESRYQAIYDLFKEKLKSEPASSGLAPQLALNSLKSMLDASRSDHTYAMLAPAAKTDSVLNGQDGMPAKIWVDNVQILSLKKANIPESEADAQNDNPNAQHGFFIQQTIVMQPKLMFQKASGELAYEELSQGQFDVFVKVVGTDFGFADQQKKVVLNSSASEATMSVEQTAAALNTTAGAMAGSSQGLGRLINGKLYAQVNFKVTSQVAEGNVDFVVRLVPRTGTRSIQEFVGIFNMGKVNSWIGSNVNGVLDQRCVVDAMSPKASNCDLVHYMGSTSSAKSLLASGDLSPNEAYLFTNVKPRFTQVYTGQVTAAPGSQTDLESTVGETSTRRTVLYSASTCITAGGSGERVPHQHFKLHVISEEPDAVDGKTVIRTKDIEQNLADDSCFYWTNTITHYYYRPEQFFRQELIFEGPGGYKHKKVVYINPWDDKFTFGFDEAELGKDFFDRVSKRPKIPSRFFTGDYAYHTVRFLYDIDPYMDLEVKKTVLMDFSPRVLRYSGILSGRKVTESLRDGIYLLKVGIQKSYLDPNDRFLKLCEVDRARNYTDGNGHLQQSVEKAVVNDASLCALSRDERRLSDDEKAQQSMKPVTNLDKFQENVQQKEFVSTKTTLVRVTDGLVIQPVELSMKDLRLMRIRSNFLLELQTVDESKVVLNDAIDQTFSNYVKTALNQARIDKDNFRQQLLTQGDDSKIDAAVKSYDDALLASAQAKRVQLTSIYQRELQRLGQEGNIIDKFSMPLPNLQGLLDDFDAGKSLASIGKDFSGLSDKQIQDLEEHYDIYKKVAQNDFTQVALPDCEKVDCESFVDPNAGLKARTFVGPVIFLSNSYKDAVRATDNLDEALCHQEIPGVDYDANKIDPAERAMLNYEDTLLTTGVSSTENDNVAYRYNKYFNSLRQFCTRTVPPKSPSDREHVEFYAHQVDDLIQEEKAWKADYASKMKALATPYNFVSIYNLDFVSFGGEKLKTLDEAHINNTCLAKGIDTCMVETSDHTATTDQLLAMANRDRDERFNHVPAWPWDSKTNEQTFTFADLQDGFFGKSYQGDSFAAVCSSLGSVLSDNLAKMHPEYSAAKLKKFGEIFFVQCVQAGENAFLRDRKIRIYATGDYVFMGGMQLNFNVGTSFSVSRSAGTSAGVDYLDVGTAAVGVAGTIVGGIFGGVPGAIIGASAASALGTGAKVVTAALKPLDLKQGKGMNDSRGTNISDSTYLVGQVAKFSIPLTNWEQCVVIRPRPELVQAMVPVISNVLRGPSNEPISDEQLHSQANQLFNRGFFVCDGIKHKDVKNIEELFFYFTQHFTEGDMLDQADLYNAPWLLSLRGWRDFDAFVQLIRAQERVDVDTFVSGFWGKVAPSELPAWSLDHMATTYKAIIPTFPGLFTELEEGEGMSYFTLDKKYFDTKDWDANADIGELVNATIPNTHGNGQSGGGDGVANGIVPGSPDGH